MWNATAQEIAQLHQYVEKMRSLGASDKKIGDQLFEDGWQVKEIRQVMPTEIRHRDRLYRFFVGMSVAIGICCAISLPFLVSGDSLFLQFWVLTLLGAWMYCVYQAWDQYGHGGTDKVTIRRIYLCLERLRVRYGLLPVSDDEQSYRELKARNPQKLFLPTVDSNYHKRLFIGSAPVGLRQIWAYVVKKISHYDTNSHTTHYDYFIFYEMTIRPVTFYFALVSEAYQTTIFFRHAHRLQHAPLGLSDFKDMQFPGNEFNRAWKLRGTDKRLAYQIFDPHMLHLLMGINQASMVGLEISDTSVILSKRFDQHSIGEAVSDVEHLRKICLQIERNYRPIH